MVEAFRTFTNNLLTDIEGLHSASTVLEFDTRLDKLKPRIGEWNVMYASFRDSDEDTLNTVADIGEMFRDKLFKVGRKRKMLEEASAPAAGGKRKMSRKYCKKTPCKKMGFSQKASCRPYKNCFTRRVRRRV
jgi:hypothetical protein